MRPTLPHQPATGGRIGQYGALLFAAIASLSTEVRAAQEADLGLVKTVDNAQPREGDTIVYSLLVTNDGPQNAPRFEISDRLPAGVSYQSHAGPGTYDETTGVWTPGLLTAGSQARLDITAAVLPGTAGTTIDNTAAITASNRDDPVPGNNGSSAAVTVVAPRLTTLKSALTLSDPVNGTASPYTIPGATVLYSVQTTNTGLGAPDADTVTVSDTIPADTELFVGASGGPVQFIDGSGPLSSGLTYTFLGLDGTADDIAFSSDNGSTWDYTPVPDAEGYDAGVTDIRVNPKGVMRASNGSDHPTFTLRFRVRVK